MKTEYEVDVDWRPFYLHPDIPPEGMPLPAYLRSRAGQAASRLDQMAHEAGLPMVHPEWISNSYLAFQCTEYARRQGKLEPFHRSVFRKYYGEGQDIGQWPVLRLAAEEAGLDGDELQRRVSAGEYRKLVDEEVKHGYALGITGVPTYILNNRFAIVGAQAYPVFEQALSRLGQAPKGTT